MDTSFLWSDVLQDAISALLLTPCVQWTLDLSGATEGDHHGLRAIAAAYRQATLHSRQVTLRGASPILQRAVLEPGGSAHRPGAGAVIPN